MYFHQSYFETILIFSFDTTISDLETRTDFFVNRFAESNGAPAIDDTVKLAGTGATSSGALHRTLQEHAIASLFKADLVIIESTKVTDKFTSIYNP